METLSTHYQPFFDWLLRSTFQASIVVCLILLIQGVLRSRLTARWHYALWLILLIRMVLPWAPQSRFSIFNLATQQSKSNVPRHVMSEVDSESPNASGESSATQQSILRQEQSIQKDGTTVAVASDVPSRSLAADPVTQPEFRLLSVLPFLWLAGALSLGGYIIICNLKLLRAASIECPSTDKEILELLEECRSEIGLRTIVALVPSEKVNTPILLGFIRPRLLVPKSITKKLTREELRYVFLHELAHVKRHDIALGWLTALLQVTHWFNPLIWLAFHRMRSNRELACDALVLSRTRGEGTQDYGRAIVSLLEHFSLPQPLPGLAGILESKSQLKRRIAMITQFKKNSYKWSPLAVMLLIMLGCVSLPDARNKEAVVTSAAKSAHKPNFRKIKIASKPKNGVLSPDGNKLAFMSDGALWAVPLHGKVDPDIAGEPVRLAEVPGIWDNGSLMAWSANGEWIAVNAWPAEEDAVSVIPAAGGEPRVIQMPKRGGHSWSYRLSLSPDGRTLAFSALELGKPPEEVSGNHDRYIYTIPTAGGEPKQVSSGSARLPSFSPDGKFIAYVGYRKRKDWPENTKASPYDGDLWVAPSTGGTPVKLASVEGRLRGPVWSPDGKYIAAHHEPGGSNLSKEIWVFPLSPDAASTGEPEKIALPHNSMDMLAGWTPEGKLGVFLTPRAHWADYTVPASGGKAVQITPELLLPYYPRWSPDGERIYFRGDDDENALVSYVPAAGGIVGRVPLQKERFNSTVPGGGHNISPDGKRIVMSASHDIWTITLDGGLPINLTNDDSHEAYPCWSPDGKWVAFVEWHAKSESEGFNAIYIVPAEGGQVRQVSSESDSVGGGAIAFSADGKRIAFFSDDSIKTIPVEGGEPEVLVAEVKSGRHSQLAYSPDGSKIAHNANDKIWITSLGGGKPEELRTGLPENAKLSEFGWSPDGEKIAFMASIGGAPEFWLIEDFLSKAPVTKPEPMTTVRKVGYEWRGPFASLSPDGK